MGDKPTLFSGAMVLALLREAKHPGTGKTQTRRLASSPLAKCQPGDRLYVREAAVIAPPGWTDSPVNPMGPRRQEVGYLADSRGELNDAARDYGLKGTPSIHMPRWASRLTLPVVEVRFQRLQDITEEDARAEGIFRCPDTGEFVVIIDGRRRFHALNPRQTYAALWDSLHGSKPGEAWPDNPPVVALTFAVHLRNIDAMEAAHG